MSVTVTVGNETFEYPSNAQSPGWGAVATETIQKIAEVLNSLSGPDDILQTTFSIANNQVAFANVTGLGFDNTTVRSATVTYSAYRVTGSNELAESGTIQVVYKNNDDSWELSREFVGDAGLIFSITDGGLFTYKSSSVSGSGYSGVLKFFASTTPQ